jgi:hypothetical protein
LSVGVGRRGVEVKVEVTVQVLVRIRGGEVMVDGSDSGDDIVLASGDSGDE